MCKDKNDPVAKAVLDAGVGMGSAKRTLFDGMGGERVLTEKEFANIRNSPGATSARAFALQRLNSDGRL